MHWFIQANMSNRSSFEQQQQQQEPTPSNNELHVEEASTQETPVKQDEKVEAAKAEDEFPVPELKDEHAIHSETVDNTSDFAMDDTEQPSHSNDPDFDEFGEFDDEFVDAADNDDDDFGDFDDFEQAEESMEPMAEEEKEEDEAKTPTEAELYVSIPWCVLSNGLCAYALTFFFCVCRWMC